MANPPVLSPKPAGTGKTFGRARLALLPVLLILLAACFVFSWMTRGAMSHLSFLNGKAPAKGQSSIVDLRPWQTAQTLSALAVSAEEREFARQAEHLADHEVDQAFASALRQAGLDAQHRTMTGEAQELKQKVAQLEQLQKQDQALVDKLSVSPSTGAKGNEENSGIADDLQVAKAQLGLDNDELSDAQEDLARASGDESPRIQEELTAHEESMKKYDAQATATGEIAVVSVSGHRTLAGRIKAWFDQRQRSTLLQQAQQQALDDASNLTAQHNALEAQLNAATASAATGVMGDEATRLTDLRDRSVKRQILSIDDDRIQTQQQLAAVYAKWSAQVDLQHSIVLHLILDSVMMILVILIAMLVCDAIIRRVMERPAMDRRQIRTLRNILELAVQIVGAIFILLVIFGPPQQTPTIIGLGTAALTFALQDYIIAFLGWFTLVGKNGIHVGDWVQINAVSGEVVEFKLMTTTLLETDQGLPTGRRITLMNSYAIRGQYFNFSTAGQWTWDEIVATVPASADMHALAQRVENVVADETRDNVERAHSEWRHGNRNVGLSRFDASPVVSLRPSGSGTEIHIRYVTPAEERFGFRNRLYQRVIELLHEPETAAQVQR